MKIVISSGHGLHVRGASCPDGLDEVDEARKVVPAVCEFLRGAGQTVVEFHDDVSTTQDQNLHRIVEFHNAQGEHDLDVSVHFNAYIWTEGGRGTEVLYVSEDQLAAEVAAAISRAGGLINRGGHKRTDLYFLNKTVAPAILIEVCFVDAATDVDQYEKNFARICEAIAAALAPELTASNEPAVDITGRVSWFGGPDDSGVDADEPLAFIYEVDDQPEIFLEKQPEGTTGLARRLDPDTFYVATRWDYDATPREQLLAEKALVTVGGKGFLAYPADWGPHEDTGRVADISPGLMNALGIDTDDVVSVVFPAPRA